MINYNTIPTNTDLATYLNACAALAENWTAANPGSFACSYHTDVAAWNEGGIFTVQDLLRHDLESTIWDLYKEVHGIRPRWVNFKEMSVADLEATIVSLHDTAAWHAEMDAQYAAQQKIEDAWRAEVDAHEATLCIPGELQFVHGTWAVA
jgi:hypothetical protein